MQTRGYRGLDDKIDERILARPSCAAERHEELARSACPLTEMLCGAVRSHGPYRHVPHHKHIDNGFVNFVNTELRQHWPSEAGHAPRPYRWCTSKLAAPVRTNVAVISTNATAAPKGQLLSRN